MKVLVTGNLGYIGCVLTRQLVEQGYDVTGFDSGFFKGKTLFPNETEIRQIFKDTRDVERQDLEGQDAVIHLAALSNDPLGELNPKLTDEINHLASVRLAKKAKNVGVERFIFSSSCSMYGASDSSLVDENSSFNPVSAYAHSKIDTEKNVKPLTDRSFAPVFLRNSTVYGLSPRMRFDLVANNMTGWAVTTGKVKMMSAGTQYRPLIHVNDVSNAFIAALKAGVDEVRGEAFNIGEEKENYQIRQVADIVAEVVPDTVVECLNKDNIDSRSYQVDFSKARKILKHFKPRYTLKQGVKQMYEKFIEIGLDEETFNDEHFITLKRMKSLMERGEVDESLKWKAKKQISGVSSNKKVVIEKLKTFENKEGRVMRHLRAGDEAFKKFGEVYYSTVKPGQVKGWKKHLECICNIVVVSGRCKIVAYDENNDEFYEVIADRDNYVRVTIPPGYWFATQCLGDEEAIIGNCASHVHRDEELVKKHISEIKYDWN